jgi:hypothetical protein
MTLGQLVTALMQAGLELGLRDPSTITAQSNSGVALRWKNDAGKYEQVKVFPEAFVARHEQITVESLKAEVRRLIEAGESEVLP